MNIGELFVNLGVKGSEKTIGALSNLKKGMGDLASTSLEAKAAIAAALYAFERLISNSAQAGTNLENFGALTDLSKQKLQQWQYSARQAGVSSEELTGNIKGVQGAMTKMLMGEGAPKGLAMIANATKNFDVNRVRDTYYVMDQLQKAAQKMPKDIGNEALKSFGLSEGTISAMRRGVFNAKNMKNAPTYSDKEISQLDKVNVAWSNLGQKVQMAVGHMTADNGMGLAKGFEAAAEGALKLLDVVLKLTEKFKVFELIGHILEGVGNTMKLGGEIMDKLGGKESKPGDILYDPNAPKKPPQTKQTIQEMNLAAMKRGVALPAGSYSAAPAMKPIAKAVGKPQQPVQMTQTLNFHHDGKDAQKVGDSTKKAVQDAYRQISAQGQGS